MGILNITPDSFFDGGKYNDLTSVNKQVSKMLKEGATFIDVGAYSSRPGATHISEGDEFQRIVPIVEYLTENFPEIVLSIDTFRSNIARKCIEAGAAIINDISGGNADTKMFETVVELQVPYIMMHMQGTPRNMQENPSYSNITQEILTDFAKKAATLKEMGLNDLIVDVGFGFGKTIEHNYELLKNLDLFHALNTPILTGISRKSMLYKPLNTSPINALNATTVANTIALQKGSQILRVHDVKEAKEAIEITELLK
ncbi:dihydropteroate synthase [Flavicella marina]|uniref:dihydropteroate synthase n=1 Tax=Flavicella marina TaxID=1475951 RepID=UPI001264C5E2|nr:dihydropteroate synthase [Flavicella marina]